MNYSAFPNTFHGDKWKITFSNIPTLDDVSDMRYFDNYVKSCSIPPYNMGQIISNLPMGFDVRHPLGGMQKNRDLGTLNISFKLSEDMYNYLVLFTWMFQLKYGAINKEHDDYFRKYNITRGTISMLDNQKRVVTDIHFTNMFLTSLGSLDLVFGSTEELIFSTEFTYEEIYYDIKNPTIGGKTITPPVNVSDCGTSGTSNTPTLDWDDMN